MKVELNVDAIVSKIPIPRTEKTIVCFGAGTAGEILLKNLPTNYRINYFADNDKKKWGKKIEDVVIINPNEIVSMHNVFVVIVSRHILSIKRQLEGYGLREDVDFVNIYSDFEKYFLYTKAINTSLDYINFVKTIKPEKLEKQHGNYDKIGIVVFGELTMQKMFFQITLYLILKMKNYNVDLILDFVGNFSDINNFEGLTEFMKELIKETLNNIKNIYKSVNYVCLEETCMELTESDYKEINKNVRDTANHYCAYVGYKRAINHIDKEKEQIIRKEIKKHVMSLKAFLTNNEYQTIAVRFGVIDRGWDYTYLGHSLGIRVPSYDADCWSTDYPACWHYDLKNKLSLNNLRLSEFSRLGEELFNNRKILNEGIEGFKQLVKYNEFDSAIKYDILIPLNLMFDGAVLGLDKIFSSPEEWIIETVDYLYRNTNAKVLIRESPAAPPLLQLNYSSYADLLSQYIDGERIIYSSKNEMVNIYNLIENSKVILPFSSTIGIEAAIMNKPVILHTSCFYENEEFVINSDSKRNYFDNIERALRMKNYTCKEREKALALFYIIRSGILSNKSKFQESELQWISGEFDKECDKNTINNMVNVIAENKLYNIHLI